MPSTPFTNPVDEFLAQPRMAVVGVSRSDGSPATAATWYLWRNGVLRFAMHADTARRRHLENDRRFSLTVLGDDGATHVSLFGNVISLVDDPDFSFPDLMSLHYTNGPFPLRHKPVVVATGEVDTWYSYGAALGRQGN
ncbi:MAG: F420-dependent oxidoreductase [Pseudonocardiales bacterium]|nr:F420-dependent oxidoreductase [Pseudonocardiales bacterium]